MKKEDIANELLKIALNESFSNRALIEARNYDCVNTEDKELLGRYYRGNQNCFDHIGLQDIAFKIRNSNKPNISNI